MTPTNDNQAARRGDDRASDHGSRPFGRTTRTRRGRNAALANRSVTGSDRAGPNPIATVCASERETGSTVTAVLQRGPLAGRHIDVNVVEGRPPKTIDLQADDGSTCRYCLADWTQTGSSARYSFLYLV